MVDGVGGLFWILGGYLKMAKVHGAETVP